MTATTKTAPDARSVSVGSIDDNSTISIHLRGSEFAPRVPRGSVVELEPTNEVAGGGGTYVVELHGHQMLQYVQRQPGRRLRLSSHNTNHEDTEIRQTDEGEWATPDGHPVEFEVIGRLVSVVDSPEESSRK